VKTANVHNSYLLFGPEATWTSHPTPLRSSGVPVFDRIQELSQAITPLLTHPGKHHHATAGARRPTSSTLGWSGPRQDGRHPPRHSPSRTRYAIAFLL